MKHAFIGLLILPMLVFAAPVDEAYTVDFARSAGVEKPLHGVNRSPLRFDVNGRGSVPEFRAEVGSSASFESRGPSVVSDAPGYNAWPMIATVGTNLVCTYSRGAEHGITEGARNAYARVSTNGGATWGVEMEVAASPNEGEVMIGKGHATDGAALFWVRCLGKGAKHHDLYRTTDGRVFTKIASPALNPFPMQITDIFPVRDGLMCLWFATNYKKDSCGAWGTLVSRDDGKTWTQNTVEAAVPLKELPTEPSVVALGGGSLLGIARTEVRPGCQFQLTSTDDGVTWRKAATNIGDVRSSTPALAYDPASDRIFNYYYERGKGKLKRRVSTAAVVFAQPTAWPAPELVAIGNEERPHDAGNVNVAVDGALHHISYYCGTHTNTTVYVISRELDEKI